MYFHETAGLCFIVLLCGSPFGLRKLGIYVFGLSEVIPAQWLCILHDSAWLALGVNLENPR